MRMRIAGEAWPFIGGSVALTAGAAALAHLLVGRGPMVVAVLAGVALTALMLFFFRDPERPITAADGEVVSGADGVVRSVEELDEPRYLKARATRISVFLSVFDVHVNRAPLGGRVVTLDYEPGKHLFAFLDAASEYNEHSSILIEGQRTRCLVRQIVGPVARRVVCWRRPGDSLRIGERFGIMKFGSRLDVFLPTEQIKVHVKKGDRVTAGRTVIASIANGD